MSLAIDNDELLRMAEEVAASRGVSVSELVEEALRDALSASRSKKAAGTKAADMIAWVRELNKGRQPDDGVTSEHAWLYDENGLPH